MAEIQKDSTRNALTFYGIRHKRTQELMPQAIKDRGYSHWNPDKKNEFLATLGVPRLLKSYKQAVQVISAWANNPNCERRFMTDFNSGIPEETGFATKEDGRTKEDLEIVELIITVKETND